MASGGDVLIMLNPDGKYVISGNDYESIVWENEVSISKEQFEAGFRQYDAWKANQDALLAAKKNALLEKLGITEDEARLLLG